jgi:hypothetical protein
MHNEKVMTARGEVVAIGELKVRKSKEFPYEIPRLSYIVVQEAENIYASTCIDLHVDGEGATLDEASENMGKNVYAFLRINFADNRGDGPGWDYLKELSAIDENTQETWNAFNFLKIELSQKGEKTDLAAKLVENVSALRKKVARLTNLNQHKEKEIRVLRSANKRQKQEIERFDQEKQKFLEDAEKLLTLAAFRSKLRYLQYDWYKV